MSTWTLGDRTVNRVGFGAMRLPQTGAAFEPSSPPRDRDQAISVLRKAVELGVDHIDTAVTAEELSRLDALHRAAAA